MYHNDWIVMYHVFSAPWHLRSRLIILFLFLPSKLKWITVANYQRNSKFIVILMRIFCLLDSSWNIDYRWFKMTRLFLFPSVVVARGLSLQPISQYSLLPHNLLHISHSSWNMSLEILLPAHPLAVQHGNLKKERSTGCTQSLALVSNESKSDFGKLGCTFGPWIFRLSSLT